MQRVAIPLHNLRRSRTQSTETISSKPLLPTSFPALLLMSTIKYSFKMQHATLCITHSAYSPPIYAISRVSHAKLSALQMLHSDDSLNRTSVQLHGALLAFWRPTNTNPWCENERVIFGQGLTFSIVGDNKRNKTRQTKSNKRALTKQAPPANNWMWPTGLCKYDELSTENSANICFISLKHSTTFISNMFIHIPP